MSNSQPARRPQGARQRTQDRERQGSLAQSGSEASYSYAQDGFTPSEAPSQGANLSRTGRRAGTLPSRSDTGASNTSATSGFDTSYYETSQPHQADSPRWELPTPSRGYSDGTRQAPRTQRSLGTEAPHLYSSPVDSMGSLRRDSERDERPRGNPSTSSLNSSHVPSLQSNTPESTQSNSYRETRTAPTPSNTIDSNMPRSSSRQQSTGQQSTEGNDDSRSRSNSLSRWATVRQALSQTPPPVPQLPLHAPTQPGLRVTPAASSVSGSSVQGSAVGFSIPRTGSAMSFITDAGLAPPPSTISNSSSNATSNSRSARAVMNLRNVVDQARTGVAGMGTGLGGMGMGGLSTLGGFTGGFGRGAGAVNATVQSQVAEDSSPFAKDLLQVCWVVQFGAATGGKSMPPTGIHSIGTAAAAGFRRPARKGTMEGGTSMLSGTAGTSITAASAFSTSSTSAEHGSLKPLLDLIINQASLLSSRNQYGTPTNFFPHQGLVLSVLLAPFLGAASQISSRGETGSGLGEREKRGIENEQWLAVEIYEVFTKAWPISKRPQEELDRWLWCCHAAAQEPTSTAVRSRLLLALDLVLSASRSSTSQGRTPDSSAVSALTTTPLSHPRNLQLLLHALFLIYPRVYGHESGAALITLNAIVSKLQQPNSTGVIVWLDIGELELDYGAERVMGETGDAFRAVITTGAAVRLLEMGSETSRRWYLLNFIEDYWPITPPWESTPLREQAERRKVLMFLKATLSLARSLISSRESANKARVGTKIIMLLKTRVLRELQWLRQDLSSELCGVLILVVLELLSVEESSNQAQELLGQWLADQGGWKGIVEEELRRMITQDDQSDVIRCITTLRYVWPGESGEFLSSLLISSLFERLTLQDLKTSLGYADILRSLASDYPQRFYGPLFACARSSNRTTVSKELRTLNAVSQAYPEFWTANAEMMCIALMSEPGVVSSQGKGKQKAGDARKWGKARLGQSVLFLELIALARRLGKDRKEDSSTPPPAQLQAINFFMALETRVAVLLEAKEMASLCPFSTRLLIASLFNEIRLLSRSLKPASWLPKMVEWGCTSHPGAMIQAPKDPFVDTAPTRAWTPVTDEVIAEVEDSIDSIRALYSSSWLESMSTPRNKTLTLPGSNVERNSGVLFKSSELELNLEVLASLPSTALAIFQLLVAVSGILQSEHYTSMGPILWNNHLDSADANSLGPVAFLLMQSAEKDPSASVTRVVSHDLNGTSAFLKRRAMDRLTKLFSWRYQVLMQPVITDRAHRRPFKSGRPPLSFVPTDIGSQTFIPDRVEEVEKLQFASTLPPEIRRRLIDLGWDKDTTKEDKRPIQNMAPLSVVPSDRLAATENAITNTAVTESGPKGLLRRKSSSGGAQGGGKRRPIFVPSIASQLNTVLQLTMSTDPEIANVARPFILEVLRDDPGLFARPILEQLSDLQSVATSISSFERALRLQTIMPSAFSHLVFNHLSGLLKTLTREVSVTGAPIIYAYSLPPISVSASLVSGISIRELRKAKLDSMLLPSGSLWFSEQMLPGPMFPRSLPVVSDSFQTLPPALVAITMVRTAQNVMLATLLKRDPKEVHSVRKSFTNFVLPSLGNETQSEQRKELVDYLPDGKSTLPPHSSPEQKNLYLISLALSRSHLLLVAQIFRCLSRQTTDYQEISQLLDGVNRILLRHGNDLGIVTHAMIDYMLAMTRFRRLFSSNGGFMLIMPAIWRAYCDAEGGNKAIRGAIEYAINRFHAIHPEAFVFQSVDVAAAMISHPDMKSRGEFASNVTSVFISLEVLLRSDLNAGGIQHVTKMYEREAILTSLNDAPETIINSFQRGEPMSNVVDQFEGTPFPLKNLARLCLTVIADDPFILRAEQFLTLFRYLTPSLYRNSMTARTFVGEGIGALGTAVFSKSTVPRGDPRTRTEDNPTMSRLIRTESGPTHGQSMFTKANSPSNFTAMKQEYLHLIVAFTKVGGQLPTDVIRRALELLKTVLRDSPGSMVKGVALFLREFTESSLLREGRPPPKQAIGLLSDIVPLIYSHGYVIDFSGVFNTVSQLCKDERLVEDPMFTKVAMGFSAAAFDALETAAAANTLQGVQFRESFVSLLVALVQTANSDPLAQLHGRTASAGLLVTVILPVCLRIPKTSSLRTGANNLRRAWIQLLGFALSACESSHVQKANSNVASTPERQGTINQGLQNSPRGMVAGLLVALQVIKVITVRAGEDLALLLPDVWLRIASVIKEAFGDGNGIFSITSIGDQDPPLSPFLSHSRPTSPNDQTDYLMVQSVQPSVLEREPRAVDYAVWSILEMLCFYRTPLNIQLRLWLQEKLLQLDARIEANGGSPNRGSFLRDTCRLSFSPFTKTRRRSGVPSAPVSPDGSPSFRPSRGTGAPPPLFLGSPNTISTFDRFPQASPPIERGIPRIRHLGPEFQAQAKVQRTRGTGGGGTGSNPLRAAAKLISISRPVLVRESHRRVEAVRVFWGYESFSGPGDDMSAFEAWTGTVALKKIVEECRELAKEFHDVVKLEIEELQIQ